MRYPKASFVVATLVVVPLLEPALLAGQEPGVSGRIVFTSDRDGNFEIYTINADGTAPLRLTDNPGDDLEPAWSPDGRMVAFTSFREENWDVYVMDADGSDLRRLTRDEAYDGTPVWSPDGESIAFTSGRDGKQEVYVMDADGRDQRSLTDNPDERDSYPSWSRDGELVAYHSTPGEGVPREICVITARGNDKRLLTDNDARDWLPAWSPAGDAIAFWSTRDGSWELYLMSDGGSAPWRLTNDPIHYSRELGGYSISRPTWSPEGQFIAFTSNSDGDYNIYVISKDGTGRRRLTSADANDWTRTGRGGEHLKLRNVGNSVL
jgi:TolB protein